MATGRDENIITSKLQSSSFDPPRQHQNELLSCDSVIICIGAERWIPLLADIVEQCIKMKE